MVQPTGVVAERERFEAPETPETIGHDLTESSLSQSVTGEVEEGREPIKPDRKRLGPPQFSHRRLMQSFKYTAITRDV